MSHRTTSVFFKCCKVAPLTGLRVLGVSDMDSPSSRSDSAKKRTRKSDKSSSVPPVEAAKSPHKRPLLEISSGYSHAAMNGTSSYAQNVPFSAEEPVSFVTSYYCLRFSGELKGLSLTSGVM